MLPEVVALAGVDELRDVQLGGVHPDEVHQLLGLVLGVEDRQLCVHADMRALVAEAGVDEADELLEVAQVLVLGSELFEVVRVHDNVHACDLGAPELARLDAGDVHLLPRLRVVGLLRSVHGLRVLPEHHVAGRQAGVVRDGSVEDLGGLVGVLVVQLVAHRLGVGGVRAADELLHVPEAVRLGVAVDELAVDELVLLRSAGHQKEVDQVLVHLLALRGLDDLHVVAGVLGLEVGLDGLRDLTVLELRLAELVPDLVVAAAGGELVRALHRLDVVQQRLHGLGVEVALLVDQEGLLVEQVRLPEGDLGDLGAVVVVKAVDVVHDARLVGLDGREDEEVLEVPVLAEVGRLVEDDLLQKLDELVGQIGADEGLDGRGDLVRGGGLRQGRAHDLVDDLAAELVLRVEHDLPELRALALDEVARLQPEEAVAVRDVDELLVAGAPRALVGGVGQVRVAVLAVLADHGGVVERVALQEGVGLAVRVDEDLGHGVVQVGVLVALGGARLQPRHQDPEAVPLLHLLDEGAHGARGADALQEVLDEVLGAVQVDEGADHLGAVQGVDLDHVDLDILHQGVLVEILRKLLDVAVQVADVDERARVGELRLPEEVLDDEGVVAGALAADALDLLHVADPAGGLDVLEVHVLVGAVRQNRTEEVEVALVGSEGLEHLGDLQGADLLVVLDPHLDHHVEVLAVVLQEVGHALERRLGRQLREVLGEELRRHGVRVEHDALEVRGLLVVLHGPLVQARLLAELADVLLVVVREEVHLQDGLRDLGRLLEVHGEQLGLELRLVGPVGLQRVQQDRCRLLEAALVHEGLHDLVDVDEGRAVLALEEALREVGGALRVAGDHAGQQLRVVRLVARLLDVGHDLVDLARRHEALDHLGVRARAQVDGEGELGVHGADDVAELLGALQLVVLEPLLDELAALLLHHRPDELNGLLRVQLAVLEQGGEVMEDRGRLARHDLHGLEHLDGLRRPERAALALRRDGGRAPVVAGGEALGELPLEELVGAREAKALRQGEGDLLAVGELHEVVHDVAHDRGLVHGDADDLTLAIHAEGAASLLAPA
mmetsp:Transcript_25740/g.76640  ORF Transcript_25740/g.76640 Transcript_25740/m.76640 type:complete len:1065 (+) Transcript_25740:1273-4467(+)